MITKPVCTLQTGRARGLLSTILTLALALAATPAPAQQMTLDEYVANLPTALTVPVRQKKESISQYGGPDADKWLDDCEACARLPILEADPDSEDKATEATKKKLRGLWNEIGRAGYTHYKRQEIAENTLISFLTETGNVMDKKKEWTEQLAKFARAVKDFDSATRRKNKSDIKTAAKKVFNAHTKARSAFEGVRDHHQYVENFAKAGDYGPEETLSLLNKAREVWDSIPEELTSFPGVKAFIAERKEEIKKIKDDYSEAYVKLLEESEDCLGDSPPIFENAGLAKTNLYDVGTYLTAKLEEATKAK